MLETARRRKLQWFCGVTRKIGTLALNIIYGGVEGSRVKKRPRISWLSDTEGWTESSVVECLRVAQDRAQWWKIVYLSKCTNGSDLT